MANKTKKPRGVTASIDELWRWSTTPPQSYLVYVVLLILVLASSYYAGTLNPKKKVGVAPQSTSLPRN
jgi:hypothetical protein